MREPQSCRCDWRKKRVIFCPSAATAIFLARLHSSVPRLGGRLVQEELKDEHYEQTLFGPTYHCSPRGQQSEMLGAISCARDGTRKATKDGLKRSRKASPAAGLGAKAARHISRARKVRGIHPQSAEASRLHILSVKRRAESADVVMAEETRRSRCSCRRGVWRRTWLCQRG